jgi:RNA polymerase sigma factor (sigma-70 family)
MGHASDFADNEANGWLDALARRYSPALARFFQRRVAQNEDVPDLVQEVFMRLARLPEYRRVQQPEQYLFTTAASALADYFRRRAVRKSDRHEIFDPEVHGGSDFSPADVLEGRQAVDRLQVALKALPERTRDVFVLRVLEEQKTIAVARALGISTRAVEQHQAKALVAISAALAPFWG